MSENPRINARDVARNFVGERLAHNAPCVDPATGDGRFEPPMLVLARTMARDSGRVVLITARHPSDVVSRIIGYVHP